MAYAVVIGAANMDVGALSGAPLRMGDSNPGEVKLSCGGVGRNIAHNLRLLGVETSLITVLGEDSFATELRQNADAVGLDLTRSVTVPGGRTSSYVYVADADGDMTAAVNDMAIYDRLTPEALAPHLPFINGAAAVVLDANLPEETIEWLCRNTTARIMADPVSAAKAPRLKNVLGRLFALKPNRLEAEALTGMTIRSAADARDAAAQLLEAGVEQVYLSLAAQGIVAAWHGGTAHLLTPQITAVSTTGGGDAMMAALAAMLAEGATPEQAARFAAGAGALASMSTETVNPAMCRTAVEELLKGAAV